MVAKKNPPPLLQRTRTDERASEAASFMMEREMFHSQSNGADAFTPGGPGEEPSASSLRQEKQQSATSPQTTSEMTSSAKKISKSEYVRAPATSVNEAGNREQPEEKKLEQFEEEKKEVIQSSSGGPKDP